MRPEAMLFVAVLLSSPWMAADNAEAIHDLEYRHPHGTWWHAPDSFEGNLTLNIHTDFGENNHCVFVFGFAGNTSVGPLQMFVASDWFGWMSVQEGAPFVRAHVADLDVEMRDGTKEETDGVWAVQGGMSRSASGIHDITLAGFDLSYVPPVGGGTHDWPPFLVELTCRDTFEILAFSGGREVAPLVPQTFTGPSITISPEPGLGHSLHVGATAEARFDAPVRVTIFSTGHDLARYTHEHPNGTHSGTLHPVRPEHGWSSTGPAGDHRITIDRIGREDPWYLIFPAVWWNLYAGIIGEDHALDHPEELS